MIINIIEPWLYKNFGDKKHAKLICLQSKLFSPYFCQTPVLGLGLGVDFTSAWDNDNYNDNNHNNNPHLNFVKGTVLGDKEQEVGIRDKG